MKNLKHKEPTQAGEKPLTGGTMVDSEQRAVRKKSKKSKKSKRHRDLPFTGTLHECKHCIRYFPSMARLNKHLEEDHPDLLDNERKDPIYSKEEFGLICKQCKQCFTSLERLQMHMNASHGEEKTHQIDDNSETEDDYSFECTACHIYFSSEVSLSEHQQAHVCVAIADCPQCSCRVHTPNPHVRSMQSQTHEFHRCDKCEDTFENTTELQWHILHKHNIIPAPVRIIESKRPGRRTLAKQPQPYKCKLCSERFVTFRAVKHHQQGHIVGKPQSEIKEDTFQCKICGEGFPQRNLMAKHTRTQHQKQANKWICHKCGQTYSSKSHLTAHMNRHDGIKSFSCQHCGKGFYTSHNFKEHLWTHTGEKPYRCTYDEDCLKRFTQKSHLNYHLKSHEKKAAQARIQQAQLLALHQNTVTSNPVSRRTFQGEHSQLTGQPKVEVSELSENPQVAISQVTEQQEDMEIIQVLEQPQGDINRVVEQPQVAIEQESEQPPVAIEQYLEQPPLPIGQYTEHPRVEISQLTDHRQVEIIEYSHVQDGVQEEVVDTTPHAVVQVHQQEILYVPLDSHVQEVQREGNSDMEQPQYQPTSILITEIHSYSE